MYLRTDRKVYKMQILEYALLVILLVSAVFIVVAVLLQKSNEDGLSGTIAGGQETFYGKDKSSHTDRTLFKLTLVAGIIFALAVAFETGSAGTGTVASLLEMGFLAEIRFLIPSRTLLSTSAQNSGLFLIYSFTLSLP